jgi:hypothetical protein
LYTHSVFTVRIIHKPLFLPPPQCVPLSESLPFLPYQGKGNGKEGERGKTKEVQPERRENNREGETERAMDAPQCDEIHQSEWLPEPE